MSWLIHDESPELTNTVPKIRDPNTWARLFNKRADPDETAVAYRGCSNWQPCPLELLFSLHNDLTKPGAYNMAQLELEFNLPEPCVVSGIEIAIREPYQHLYFYYWEENDTPTKPYCMHTGQGIIIQPGGMKFEAPLALLDAYETGTAVVANVRPPFKTPAP